MIIAKAAYDAYCTARGWKSVTGQALPPFDGQTEELQRAWQLAAEAAVNESEQHHTLTCVYCGQAYPEGTPRHGDDVAVLTEHLRQCAKHPMRRLEKALNACFHALSSYAHGNSSRELAEETIDYLIKEGLVKVAKIQVGSPRLNDDQIPR